MKAPLVDVPISEAKMQLIGVDQHRLLDFREIAVFIEQISRRADCDQSAQRIQKAHQHERDQDGQSS